MALEDNGACTPFSLRDLDTEHSPERFDLGGWGEPDLALLGTGRRAAPAFPLSLLGPWAEWVEAEAAAASSPPDFVAAALLACAGATLGNVRWPLAGADWSEPPVLNLAAVGGPGSGKSPGLDRAIALVRHAEDEMAAGFDAVQADYDTRKQAGDARLENWRAEVKAAVKTGEDPPSKPLDAEPEPPVRPRIIVSDATTERLAILAAGLPRGLLLQRDELAGFLSGLDRYSGGGSDRAFMLEAFGGRPFTVDRVKHAQPVVVPRLSIGVAGGIQPERLSGLLDSPDDGLVARFLWCWPEAVPDFRLCRETRDHDPMRAAFARLTRIPMGRDRLGRPEPIRLRLTKPAEAVLEAFGRETMRQAAEAAGLFGGTLSKSRGHALRLALVIEFLWWCASPDEPEPEAIDEPAMRAAAELVRDYFVPMAQRVFGDAAVPVPERRAMHLARHLRRTGTAMFNARDLRREVGGLLRDAGHMDEACKGLVEAGLIRPQAPTPNRGKGRPAKVFDVNPVVFARRS